MIVLGIDPGTATTGYGLVKESPEGAELVTYGAILTPKTAPMGERMIQIYQQVGDLIREHHP